MFGHHETSATRTLTLRLQTNQSLLQYEVPGVVCLQSKFGLQKTLRFGATAYFLALPKARNFGQSHVFPARRCRPKKTKNDIVLIAYCSSLMHVQLVCKT